MTKDDTKQSTATEDRDLEERRDPAPAPRGNPETDHESVEKGEEQLGKVVGN